MFLFNYSDASNAPLYLHQVCIKKIESTAASCESAVDVWRVGIKMGKILRTSTTRASCIGEVCSSGILLGAVDR